VNIPLADMTRKLHLADNLPDIEVRSKVWFEVQGKTVMCEGRAELLRRIQETQSINLAAKQMGLSFRRAWAMIKEMEDSFGIVMVERRRGGSGGGLAIVQDRAIELLHLYERIFTNGRVFTNE